MTNIHLTSFQRWLGCANPGDSHVYHRGMHLQNSAGAKLIQGCEAWRAYEEGKVYLVQRRCADRPLFFEYLAIRRPERIVNRRRNMR